MNNIDFDKLNQYISDSLPVDFMKAALEKCAGIDFENYLDTDYGDYIDLDVYDCLQSW